MGNLLLINGKKYLISVKVLTGPAGGMTVVVDEHGKIKHIDTDPGPMREGIMTAIGQIEAGAEKFETVTAGIKGV